jgi:uncharacterized protein with HEPN domain
VSDPKLPARLRSLLKIAEAELHYLKRTDARLFAAPLTIEHMGLLPGDDELAERVDAFVARFGRLQDTVGDKLLPTFLVAMAETPGTALENLDRAEKLGLIQSADVWQTLRKMRNRMIHEYVAEAGELLGALIAAHQNIPALAEALTNIRKRLIGFFPELAFVDASSVPSTANQSSSALQ